MADKHADWWATWWKRDYSWEGLGEYLPDGTPKHPWEGWIVHWNGTINENPNNRPNDYYLAHARAGTWPRIATLQDYWRDQENELIPDPTSRKYKEGKYNRHFTRFHLPFYWQDGTPTGKADWGDIIKVHLGVMIDRKLDQSAETQFEDGELAGPDRRVQFQGGVFLYFTAFGFRNLPSKPNAGPSPIRLNWRSEHACFSGDARFISASFSGNARFDRATFSGSAGFDRATFSGYAGFNGATFSGNARFDRATFSGSAGFDLATFSGYAGFNGATFSGEAWFNSANFSGDAWLESATFSGAAGFSSATFSGVAWFDSATFSGDAGFERATFSGDAGFESAIFSESAWFNSATFSGDAGFERATFSGHAWFNSATFSGYAGFNSATFSGDAGFELAIFSESAWFNSATFSGYARFESATFSGDARFDSATFSGDARFESAIFAGNTSFKGEGVSFSVEPFQILAAKRDEKDLRAAQDVQFTDKLVRKKENAAIATRAFREVDFTGAVFLGAANFNNRDFTEATKFDRAEFHRSVSFHGSRLHQGVSFLNAVFRYALHRDRQRQQREFALRNWWDRRGGRDWPQVSRKISDRLYRAYVRSRATQAGEDAYTLFYEFWLADEFEAKRTKEAEAFAALPKFKFDPMRKGRFYKRWFAAFLDFLLLRKAEEREGETQEDYFEPLESCFRTLKLAMEDKRDRVMEGKFFQLELKARRRRRKPNVLFWERIASDFYGIFSDYGNSVVRPLVWIFASVVIFACIYWLLGIDTSQHPVTFRSGSDFWEALSYSAGRVLAFGPWRETPPAGSMMGILLNIDGEGAGRRTAFGIRLLASFQSVLAIILVFLSGLAVRRRFQIN